MPEARHNSGTDDLSATRSTLREFFFAPGFTHLPGFRRSAFRSISSPNSVPFTKSLTRPANFPNSLNGFGLLSDLTRSISIWGR